MSRTLASVLLVCATAALAPVAAWGNPCSFSVTRLCLRDSRFGVEVAWAIPGGASGVGHASPLSNDTGLFWFFNDSNLELVVKVLDGRAINGHFWVYYGGLSDVEYTITVTDSKTGATEIYHNPASRLASGADTSAFAAEPLAAGGTIRSGMLGGASAGTAGKATTVAAVPLRQGSELPVNVTTEGVQLPPRRGDRLGGGFMVVWAGESPPYGLDVFGRFFDAAGNPRGGEIRLNGHRIGTQSWPRVAASPEGGYMVAWNDGGFVLGSAFGENGQPIVEEIEISQDSGPPSAPAIVAADGGYVVAWPSPFGFDGFEALFGRRFDLRGNPSGIEIPLVAESGTDLAEPRLAAWPGGGFVATWLAGFLPGPGLTVEAQRFDEDSDPVGEPILVTADGPGPLKGNHQQAAPVVHPDSSFSIVWTTISTPANRSDVEGLFARRFSPTGTPASGWIELRRGHFPQVPATVSLFAGDALVLWTEAGRPLDPDGGVLARLFDSSWAPRGPEFRVNAFTVLQQTEPAVASDGAGHLLAVWSSGMEATEALPMPSISRRTAAASASSASASPRRAAERRRTSSASPGASASPSRSRTPFLVSPSPGTQCP